MTAFVGMDVGSNAVDSTGLLFFNARYLDPYLNRWIQPDSIVAGSGALTVNPLDSFSAHAFYSGDRGAPPRSPQELNRYSYALNSPTNHTDATGHFAPCPRCGFANWIWTAVTSVLGLPSSVDISGRGIVNAVAVQLSCGVIGGICKVEDGVLQATTNGEMMEQGVVAFGATVLSNPLSGMSCPNCGHADPLLLRSRGAIAARQHVTNLAHVGQDGISAWCSGCTPPSGKFWGRTSGEIRNFATSLGLDPNQALVHTPQFVGEGHYSLFIDAIGADGYLLDDYANAIDEFLRAGAGSTNP